MSTRATYSFGKNRNGVEVIIYDHYDGYPEGAAVKFMRMIDAASECRNAETISPESFIRGNNNAEITHGNHGDTEFHYQLYGKTVEVTARKTGDRVWSITKYELVDFINAHGGEVAEVDGTIYTSMTAERAIAQMQDLIQHWDENGVDAQGQRERFQGVIAKLQGEFE